MHKRGTLFIVSGPSGVGKDTILKEMLMKTDHVRLSVSCTTRLPRVGEMDGVDYRFVSKEYFENLIKQDDLLEYAEYCGTYYGTPRKPVEKMLSEGISVILKIERVGMEKVIKKCPDAVTVFIEPPSMDELKRRILKRNTDSPEAVKRRLRRAVEEIELSQDYQYRIISGDLQKAVNDLCQLIKSYMN
mgnify:CR=1 FL=1